MPDRSNSIWFWIIAALAAGAVAGGLIVMYSSGKQAIARMGPQSVYGAPFIGIQTVPGAVIMTNKEEIAWTDRKGRERTITIHREVH